MAATSFLRSLVGATLALAGALGGINAAMDPYLFWGTPRWPGINAVKPAVETREAMMKAYHAPRMQARTLVLGSSRADIALNPEDAVWPAEYRPVYNLSLVGSDLSQDLHYARHVMASNGQHIPTTTLVVGLDFENFLVQRKSALPAADRDEAEYERLAVTADGGVNPGRRLRQWKDAAAALFSLDALMDSALVLHASRDALQADMREDGHQHPGHLQRWTQSDGFSSMFEQKHAQFLKSMGAGRRVLDLTPDGQDFKSVQALLALAKERHLKIVLLIQPAHASRMELLDGLGYWPALERWKTVLTREVAQARAAGVDVALWDFATYDPRMQEPVPPAGDRKTAMQWFWDPVHPQQALGSLMLARALGGAAADLGARLEPQGLQSHLEAVRRQREAYRATQPAEVQRVRQLLCAARGCDGADGRQQVADRR